jgi:hypothetical protein
LVIHRGERSQLTQVGDDHERFLFQNRREFAHGHPLRTTISPNFTGRDLPMTDGAEGNALEARGATRDEASAPDR